MLFYSKFDFKIITNSQDIAKKYREVHCTHHLASPKGNIFHNNSTKARKLTLVNELGYRLYSYLTSFGMHFFFICLCE